MRTFLSAACAFSMAGVVETKASVRILRLDTTLLPAGP